MKTIVILKAALCIAVMGLAPAAAHEMFLKTDRYVMSPDSAAVLQLFNGTFNESANVIDRYRMRDVSIVHHGEVRHPAPENWFDKGNISFLNIATGAPGTYVAGVSTRTRIINLLAKDFADYLRHDGVLDALAEFERDNSLATVRERYSKHVRAIFQVGDARTGDYRRKLGYPVEILLQSNPYDLGPGDDMTFQILYNDRPAAGQLIYVSYEGFHGHDHAGGHVNAFKLRTDDRGMARFGLKKPGKWYISLIHMKKVDEPDVDYQSDWATLTFEVRQERE